MRLLRLLMKNAKGAPTVPYKAGTGPEAWQDKFTGLKWKEMKHHYSIIPIYGMTLFAMGMAAAYVYRLATKHPEVSWSQNNQDPYDEYKNRQYKFMNPIDRDYSKPHPAPKYRPED